MIFGSNTKTRMTRHYTTLLWKAGQNEGVALISTCSLHTVRYGVDFEIGLAALASTRLLGPTTSLRESPPPRIKCSSCHETRVWSLAHIKWAQYRERGRPVCRLLMLPEEPATKGEMPAREPAARGSILAVLLKHLSGMHQFLHRLC